MMWHRGLLQDVMVLVGGISALSLIVAVALPHHHAPLDTDDVAVSDASDLDAGCRAGAFADVFSATPPVVPVSPSLAPSGVFHALPPHQPPRTVFVARFVSPRAPPTLA